MSRLDECKSTEGQEKKQCVAKSKIYGIFLEDLIRKLFNNDLVVCNELIFMPFHKGFEQN